MNRIYIGFEPKAAAAYWIQKASIERHWKYQAQWGRNTIDTPSIKPIVQQALRMAGLYERPVDPLASTEFTYTRFFVPYLAGYDGWALFMDGDMMARADFAELFDLADERYAAMCVQHMHVPNELVKMGDKAQTIYPRKNWSSLVLWNCGHPKNRQITPEIVNKAGAAYLHQFKWLDDDEIGALPEEWNWLVDESPTIHGGPPPKGWTKTRKGEPKNVHFTNGIPGIHEGYDDCPYAAEYLAYARRLTGGGLITEAA